MRDVFGSILFLSLKQRIGMGVVLKYPLTQVLLYFANVDESMKKHPKQNYCRNGGHVLHLLNQQV